MARVLISDPSPAIAELYALVVRGMGHEAVRPVPGADFPFDVDAVVLEPDDPVSLYRAQTLHVLFPTVPVICVSIRDRMPAADLQPSAYLVKPFALEALARALDEVLH